MFYRFSCAAVVVFWCVMTTMLVTRSYFSSEDRLPVVEDVDSVIERAVANRQSSNLVVYRDMKEVGTISITPRKLPSGASEILMTALGEIGKQEVIWRGEVELTPTRDVVRFKLKVIFSEQDVKVTLEFDPESMEFDYRVEQDGLVLVDSDDETSKIVKRVKLLLTGIGLSPAALKRKEARGGSPVADDAIVARYGKVVIADVRQTAYIIELSPSKSRRLKFYFSESGELLKVGDQKGGPVMGYDIIAEGFKFPPGDGADGEGEAP